MGERSHSLNLLINRQKLKSRNGFWSNGKQRAAQPIGSVTILTPKSLIEHAFVCVVPLYLCECAWHVCTCQNWSIWFNDHWQWNKHTHTHEQHVARSYISRAEQSRADQPFTSVDTRMNDRNRNSKTYDILNTNALECVYWWAMSNEHTI